MTKILFCFNLSKSKQALITILVEGADAYGKGPKGEMLKVSLLDSNPSSAERVASALTKSGFEVIIASSEVEGLEIVDKASPDAVIVRDSPPQLDGFTFCWQIRRSFNLPLILLGDKPETEVYPPTFEAPADWDYYMHLPISCKELAARIKVLLWRYGKAELPQRDNNSI